MTATSVVNRDIEGSDEGVEGISALAATVSSLKRAPDQSRSPPSSSRWCRAPGRPGGRRGTLPLPGARPSAVRAGRKRTVPPAGRSRRGLPPRRARVAAASGAAAPREGKGGGGRRGRPMAAAGPSRSLYEALGLEPDAADAAVRGAYKKAAVKWHPDQHVRPFALSGSLILLSFPQLPVLTGHSTLPGAGARGPGPAGGVGGPGRGALRAPTPPLQPHVGGGGGLAGGSARGGGRRRG